MPWIRTRDGTDIYVKDWGSGRPVILIHGYPLNFDSFDRTAMHLAEAGFRVINYDRRGFGRSGQPWGGHDWDTDSDDLADVMQAAGHAGRDGDRLLDGRRRVRALHEPARRELRHQDRSLCVGRARHVEG